MRPRHHVSRLALMATLAFASPAFAEVLDQEQPYAIGGMWRPAAVSGAGITGATFTAGVAGPLTRLDVGLARMGDPGTLTLTLFSTDEDGLPLTALGGTQLASAGVHVYQDDGQFPLYSIDLSALGIGVAPGARYAYALSATVQDGVSNFLMVAGTEGDVYVPGGFYVTSDEGLYIYPQHDGVFRTWVDAAVPAARSTWGAVKALYR